MDGVPNGVSAARGARSAFAAVPGAAPAGALLVVSARRTPVRALPFEAAARRFAGAFRLAVFALALVLLGAASAGAQQVRIKDVAQVGGISEMQLVGYGLVVGLPGTGDGPAAAMTLQSTMNMLRNMGLEVDRRRVRVRNAASVMVTAKLPAFSKPGSKLDVTVSSIGDARSLAGGVLLLSPLKGVDDEVYAMAQGPVAVGGAFAVETQAGASLRQNVSTTAVVPMGGIVERENLANRLDQGPLRITLQRPDFSSAVAMAKAVDDALGAGAAIAEDAATVRIDRGEAEGGRPALIARVENLKFEPSRTARVVVNERTGTIVAGSDVRISEVAVTHGSLTIRVTPNNEVSQPAPFSQGVTTTVSNPDIDAQEKERQMKVLPANTNVGELAQALNALGASPRDVIAILQAIQASGALQAELVVM